MRIYFCSDLHASRKCWKKFLASATFYEADHIICGGDITGKFVVPIVEQARGVRTATFLGIERRVETLEALVDLQTKIADAGQYAFETTPDEQAWYAEDQARIDELFRRLVLERAQEWVTEADEKLAGSGVRVFVSGANDDFLEVDDVIARSQVIEDPNGTVIELEGGYELLGMGWGNPTPWACPRDISEEELAERIDRTAEKARDVGRTIFSLHVPPFGSGLDVAPKLDEYLTPRVGGMGFEMVPVGSTATRDAIARYQPMVGLHGHIHESKGVKRIGSTPIANPGSEYGEGVLDGLLVDIDANGVKNLQLVSG
ncbi:MAG: metallophosphoesterase family protein [Actinomycetota bacterium]